MTNLKWVGKYSLISAFFFVLAMAMPAQSQSWDYKDKAQMKQLALESCLKTRNEGECACFAESLLSNFNDKDWRIFIADQSKSSAPPSGITENDLDQYGRKLAAAGNACK